MPDAGQWMTIGRTAGPFGVRGEIKVEILTDFPERFADLVEVHLGPRHVGYAVAAARRHKNLMLLRLEGVETPEAAEKLRGQDVMVPREQAVDLPEGHYFLEDLIGLAVQTSQGEAVGRITDVLRTGSNDVYVVNEGREALLIPAIKDAVRDVDLDGGLIVIEPWVLQAPE